MGSQLSFESLSLSVPQFKQLVLPPEFGSMVYGFTLLELAQLKAYLDSRDMTLDQLLNPEEAPTHGDF